MFLKQNTATLSSKQHTAKQVCSFLSVLKNCTQIPGKTTNWKDLGFRYFGLKLRDISNNLHLFFKSLLDNAFSCYWTDLEFLSIETLNILQKLRWKMKNCSKLMIFWVLWRRCGIFFQNCIYLLEEPLFGWLMHLLLNIFNVLIHEISWNFDKSYIETWKIGRFWKFCLYRSQFKLFSQ